MESVSGLGKKLRLAALAGGVVATITLGFGAATATSATTRVFTDEFNASGRVGSQWIYDTGTGYPGGPQNGFGTDEIEVMTDRLENIRQEAGYLRITPIRSASGWTSGRVETARVFKPAPNQVMRIEAKLAYPDVHGAAAKGYWPAFWAMGETQRANRWLWPANGELDMAESVNGINRNWSTLHCGYAAQWGGPCNEPNGISNAGKSPAAGDLWGQQHRYAVEWDRTRGQGNDQLRWYLDGNRVHTVNQADATVSSVWRTMTEHNGYFVILNLAIGGQFPANQGGGPDAGTVSGKPMLVDWVHVDMRGASSTPSPTTAPPTATPTSTAPTTAPPTSAPPTSAPPTTRAPTAPNTTTPPTALNLHLVKLTTTSAQLAWNPKPGASYRLARAGVGLDYPPTTTGGTLTDVGLIPNTPYLFGVEETLNGRSTITTLPLTYTPSN